MAQESKGRFQLIHGCISLDESFNSRDVPNPEYFETIPEAEKHLQERAHFYKSMGYKVWFSNIREWNPKTKEYQEIPPQKL